MSDDDQAETEAATELANVLELLGPLADREIDLVAQRQAVDALQHQTESEDTLELDDDPHPLPVALVAQGGDALDALVVEGQSVEERAGGAALARRGEILRVRRQDVVLAAPQQPGRC